MKYYIDYLRNLVSYAIIFLNKYIDYIRYILIFISFTSFIILIFPGFYKDFAGFARDIFIVVMFVRPLYDIFPDCKLFSFLYKFRRDLSIILGFFVFAHVFGYFLKLGDLYTSILDFLSSLSIYNLTNYLLWGFVAFVLCIPLFVTSNSLSTKLLGKKWKTLQRLSYIMFISAGLHIFFLEKDIGPIFVLFLWGILFFIAYKKNNSKKIGKENGKRWVCIPCGYIYDEKIGDKDSGILPGTKFEDIPNNWRCPVCGVGKNDFVLLDLKEYKNIAKVLSIIFLTSNVIEVEIETEKELYIKPGQFVNFLFEDKKGKFERSYSVSEQNGRKIKFLIKIINTGRGGKLWINTIKEGYKIELLGPYGEFILKDTTNIKVFIATGTGLSPIYNMLLNVNKEVKKNIYFGVQTYKDLFYECKLNDIKNLNINIFLSKEKKEGYNFGRITINEDFPENTEFYICGNPNMVDDMQIFLKGKGYKNIFNEKFFKQTY